MSTESSQDCNSTEAKRRAGIRKEYSKQFVVSEAKLRKLCDVLREHAEKLSETTYLRFHVQRENDSFYETVELDEVLGDDNAEGREITLLGIEIHEEEGQGSAGADYPEPKNAIAWVIFRRDRDESVRVNVRAKDRDWCFVLFDDIDSQLQRVMYKPVALRGIAPVVVDAMAAALLSLAVMLTIEFFAINTGATLSESEINSLSVEQGVQKLLELRLTAERKSMWILLGVWLAAILPLAGFLLRPVTRASDAMRRSVFYWGDAATRHDAFESRMGKIKWGIVIAFVVSFLATIVGALILE